jgi:uncharacterized protein YbgA (DUF1722 family)/uncharacterized protein YbbK (DUF523 family)
MRGPVTTQGRGTEAGGEQGWLRPVVVVSECLGFGAVRYNGQILPDRVVDALRTHVAFVPTCPEVGIGLGVPRDAIRLVSDGSGGQRLVQPSTGTDLTGPMRSFTADFLAHVGPVDGFILKNRSPTCGIRDVKVYPAEAGKPASEKSSGLFAAAMLQRFPAVAVEDEGRLTNARIRHHFLTWLFASAELREVIAGGRMRDLVAFHTRYKLQLMAQGQQGLRQLGRIVAEGSKAPFADVAERYAAEFARVMARAPRVPSLINVLQHAFGYFSQELGGEERAYFAHLLDEYRAERLPLSAVLSVLQAWILRFDTGYLATQRLFHPFPRVLLNLADSGAGRA